MSVPGAVPPARWMQKHPDQPGRVWHVAPSPQPLAAPPLTRALCARPVRSQGRGRADKCEVFSTRAIKAEGVVVLATEVCTRNDANQRPREEAALGPQQTERPLQGSWFLSCRGRQARGPGAAHEPVNFTHEAFRSPCRKQQGLHGVKLSSCGGQGWGQEPGAAALALRVSHLGCDPTGAERVGLLWHGAGRQGGAELFQQLPWLGKEGIQDLIHWVLKAVSGVEPDPCPTWVPA